MLKNELKNIIQGKSNVCHGELIQAIALYLRGSKKTSTLDQTKQYCKKQETEELISYINLHNLWVCDINFDAFISEGAEQKVYVKDIKKVLKLNDSIYYAYWEDYFINLLLNNYFFPETAYNLIGFYKSTENILYALVEQKYVKANEPTNLQNVKDFLENNGFICTKNNDYYNPKYGPNSPNSVHPGKAGINTGMAAYGLWVNPIGSILYSVIDNFYPGGWVGASETATRTENQEQKMTGHPFLNNSSLKF